jgi:hypothetical protein
MTMAKRFKEDLGKGSFANMPENVIQKEYPKSNMFDTDGYEDTQTGIDMQTSEDVKGMRKSNKKSLKY